MRLKTYKGAGIALFKKTSEGYSILLGKRTFKSNGYNCAI